MFDDAGSNAPFRIVGLFTEESLRAGQLMDAIERVVKRLPEDDVASSLVLLPFGANDEAPHAFRAVMRPGDATAPAEALVRVFDPSDAGSPHMALVDKVARVGDPELTAMVAGALEGARTFVEVAMGGLDHPDRILPFLALVKMLVEATDALLVDPGSLVVGNDMDEWSGAARMSIEMELAIPALGRRT